MAAARFRVRVIFAAIGLAAFVPMQVAAHASGGTTTGADLQMSGSASTGSPVGGAAFTYTFQVKNSGPQTATAATFTDTLLDSVSISSATVNGNAAACSIGTDSNGLLTVTCNLGDVTSGSQVNVVEKAVAPAATTLVGIYDNTPSAQSAVSDPNPANNQSTVEIKVPAAAPAPALQPGPCATITPQSPLPMTSDFATVTLKATITSCSQLIQPNLAVAFNGGTSIDGYVFTCTAPQNPNNTTPVPLSVTLSPGASTSATCKHDTFVSLNSPSSSYLDSGTGTATLFADCQNVVTLSSVSNYPSPCSNVLATGTYPWQVNVPFPPGATPPPPRK